MTLRRLSPFSHVVDFSADIHGVCSDIHGVCRDIGWICVDIDGLCEDTHPVCADIHGVKDNDCRQTTRTLNYEID